MVFSAIPLLALVTALSAGCNARSSQTEVAAGAAATEEHSAGAERGLPEVESYAHRLDEPERDAWQKPEEVIELLDCRKGATVVDLGAGTGYFIPRLSQAVGETGTVLGLDISPSAVRWLERVIEEEGLGNVEALAVAPDDPGLGPRSVDRVLVVNTWHHVEGRVDYARKLLPALRRRGRLLIVDFTMEATMGPPPEKRLTIDTVTSELEAAGFETEVLEALPHHYVVAAEPH